MKPTNQFNDFTAQEIEQHYQPLMHQCKTPNELCALLEEWRRALEGWIAPWMQTTDPDGPYTAEDFPERQ